MTTALNIAGTVFTLISVGLYTFTHYKVPSIWVLFLALVVYAFSFCWLLQSHVKKTPKLKEPTFSEAIEEFNVSFGEKGIPCSWSIDGPLNKNRAYPFTVNDYSPVEIYLKNGILFADVKVYGGYGFPAIEIKQNKLFNKPASWDFNSNDKALEVVDQNQNPIYQFYYKTPSHIIINGVFPYEGGIILAGENGVVTNLTLPATFKLKRIFKYPAWQHPGEYES